jgi:epoxyqueuosine reductase
MNPDAESLILIARSLGFSRLGVVNLDSPGVLAKPMSAFREWIAKGYAGEMAYLARHADLRANPAALLTPVSAADSSSQEVASNRLAQSTTRATAAPAPSALRAIVVTMDYLPAQAIKEDWREREAKATQSPERAVVSVYAHGRDYHKVMRSRLVQLAAQCSAQHDQQFQFRACVDSAPVLEVTLAQLCGLGWRGKHTLLLNREQGSMFFLGVLFTNMPLDEIHFDQAFAEQQQALGGHCGTCTSCLEVCPTQAFVSPFELDARRCISYLTIEHSGSIPLELRPLMGNRVYGCDDCQRVCPWNRYAQVASVSDFDVRHGLDHVTLLELFSWTEAEFLSRHQGSAILRIGYLRWLRNLAVGLGNALASADLPNEQRAEIIQALSQQALHPSDIVQEHVAWALAQTPQHQSRDAPAQ